MNSQLKNDTWIFVVVQDPGGNEQFFGLHDEEGDVSFIPAFYKKEDAQHCLIHLPTQRGRKYEVQAVMFGDLSGDAAENNFWIFLLDEDGKILDKILPGHSQTPIQ